MTFLQIYWKNTSSLANIADENDAVGLATSGNRKLFLVGAAARVFFQEAFLLWSIFPFGVKNEK